MARGRASSYEDQRELILARSAALFAQSGYPATSMNQVAQACGLSKPTLYHYYRDKYDLLVQIAEGHVSRLEALVDGSAGLDLRALIHRLVAAYAGAQHAHRVLTEDVKFLRPDDRERVLAKERKVVKAFAAAVRRERPGLQPHALDTPLTMLLFGMVNWMFTWHRSSGPLSHEQLAPLVADLFLGGLGAVQPPQLATPETGDRT